MLLASVASDPDLIARFEREAFALAALHHPHIAFGTGANWSRERMMAVSVRSSAGDMQIGAPHTLFENVGSGGDV